MTPRLMKLSVLAVAMTTASACVSVLPAPDTPRALLRIEAASVRPQLSASLIVREPEAPQMVAGRALVSRDASGANRLMPSVEWSGRATRQMQLALVDSFSVDGAGAALLPETGIAARLALTTRIQSLELHGDEAVCRVSVAVHDLLAQTGYFRQTEIAARQLASDGSTRARADALKLAGEQCVREMADFAAEAVAGAMETPAD